MNFNADFHPFRGPERCPSSTLCGPQGLNPAIIGLILDSTLILVFTFLTPERPIFRHALSSRMLLPRHPRSSPGSMRQPSRQQPSRRSRRISPAMSHAAAGATRFPSSVSSGAPVRAAEVTHACAYRHTYDVSTTCAHTLIMNN